MSDHLENKRYEQAMEKLSTFLVNPLKDIHHSEVENFEQFSQRQKLQLNSLLHNYRQRFLNGYKAILQELAKEDTGK